MCKSLCILKEPSYAWSTNGLKISWNKMQNLYFMYLPEYLVAGLKHLLKGIR